MNILASLFFFSLSLLTIVTTIWLNRRVRFYANSHIGLRESDKFGSFLAHFWLTAFCGWFAYLGGHFAQL